MTRLYIYAAIALAAVGAAVWADRAIRSDERQKIERQAAVEAGRRIMDMEKNNAEFRALSPRDRCRLFMRDSGLPDSACDER